MNPKTSMWSKWRKQWKEQTKCLWYETLIFPVFLCYLEIMFHLLVFRKLDYIMIYSLLQALLAGTIINALACCFKRKVNAGIIKTFMIVYALWFAAQLVYYDIFRTFLSVNSIRENGGDVMEFWKQALDGIVGNLFGILVFILPLFFIFRVMKQKGLYKKRKPYFLFAHGVLFLCIFLLFTGGLSLGGKDPYSAYDLYHNDFVTDLGVEKLGLLTATRYDIHNVVFGQDTFLAEDDIVSADTTPIPTDIPAVTATPTVTDQPQQTVETITDTPAPTKEPVDTSPNVLPIDFTALAKDEKNEAIANLHKYFASVEPTRKNEYTGMFKDYNLILFTAEGFCPFAVDEKITPTLYKLTHSGFVFENFYNPIWWTSTSDGEFVECTGLIPYGSNSMTKSADCDMPLCPGWQFLKLGYTARAYHNHTYTYYHRDRSHPNMGYDYKGVGNGLEVKKTWPESDLEMMEKTIPEFINDEKFHVYYMTVSGHMQYTFLGNSMASKNREYVKDLPYSDNCKAYIACQKELDLALEYLIQQLDEKGVLDRTVIALSADHYPYGLTMDEINELAGHKVDETFELYKNNFILWNSAMEEPVTVTKYCDTLDILPTLYNLFGIDYDSRLFFGQDILSDASPLVMVSNQSFITDLVSYDSKTGKVIYQKDKADIQKNYVKQMIKTVRNKFNASASVIKNNYYSYLSGLK